MKPTDISTPDDHPLEAPIVAPPPLPKIVFSVTEFPGTPDEAKAFARSLAEKLAGHAKFILKETFPDKDARIVVALQ